MTDNDPRAAALVAREKPLCGARLEVTIRSTTHSFRCVLPRDHAGPHCTPQDSEWTATAPKPEPMCACGGHPSHCVGPR